MDTPPGPSFWPTGGAQGKLTERVEGIAQPDHALPKPTRPPALQAGRAVVVTEGSQGTKAKPPRSSLPPPTPYLSASHLFFIALQRCPSNLLD